MIRRLARRYWHWGLPVVLAATGLCGVAGPWWIAAAVATAVLLLWREHVLNRRSIAAIMAEAAARRKTGMPAGHPEWFTRLLGEADEGWLAAAAAETWQDDEYLAIVHEFHHKDGGRP
jgi:hypothetical protein